MKVYLAGPMRGIPDYNYPAFNSAAKRLREMGHQVFNPAEHGADIDAESDDALRQYMLIDLPAVLSADVVVALVGWQVSTGAALEMQVATTCGIPCFDYAGAISGDLDDLWADDEDLTIPEGDVVDLPAGP